MTLTNDDPMMSPCGHPIYDHCIKCGDPRLKDTTFSDVDLKRLKDICLGILSGASASIGDISDLIARLEAAERLVKSLIDNHDWIAAARPDLEAWGKASGKSPTGDVRK